MCKYLLGIDNGLTSTKAVIFDFFGNEIGMCASKSNIESNGDIVEIDMQELWENTATTVKKAIENANICPTDIVAVANSAHGNGLFILDKNENPIRKAILPMDKRANTIIEKYFSNACDNGIFEDINQQIWAGQPAPILRWLKENENESYKKINRILFCKDFLKFKLTGACNTDYSDISAAGLFNNKKKQYDRSLFEKYGIQEVYDKLPFVSKSTDICGNVTEKASQKTGLKVGTPVATGVFDVNACCIGTGVIEKNIFSVIAGTWSINSCISDACITSNDIVQATIFADAKHYLCIESSATSTVNLEWFLNEIAPKYLQNNYSLCEEIVSSYKSNEIDMIFIPFIYGSLKCKGVNAGFYNIRQTNNYKDMLRSVYEGIAFGHRMHIEALNKIGLRNNVVRFTGGASKSDSWCQIFADVLNLEIQIVNTMQSGAMGAAIVAGICCEIYNSYEDAVNKTIRVCKTFLPSKDAFFAYDKKYTIFKKIIEALQ